MMQPIRVRPALLPTESGSLVYRASEYSIEFHENPPERVFEGGIGSLTIDTLQIRVDIATRQLTWVYGLFPSASWASASVNPPGSTQRALTLDPETELRSGWGIPISNEAHWERRYDSTNGWLCVSLPTPQISLECFEIATSTVVGVNGTGQIASVWLKPELIE